ncbi:MFS transporter [Arthrobacter koreensis]|uniref:MFS transporter n=1 Tax=Arthrobacter koreensis TaxID=199136 RepID=UPI002DBBE06E|nr:MFS transporter [Arthrobacter koreensis]MEB7505516.1 MFS transporter [Arthrobacter koreensis]
MLSVLRNATYSRLFAAQVIALLGTGLLTVGLGLLAYDLAGSNAGAVMGTALLIKMLAYVGLSPVINALVSRLPKKTVLITADIVRALMALLLPFITEIWQVYVLIFLLQAASATFTPAFQSLIPQVLPDQRQYTHALSLSRLAYDLEALVSPALAALLLTVVSYNNLFVGTVAGFLCSAALVAVNRLPRRTADDGGEPGPLWHRTTLGMRIFWRTPRLRSLLALNLVVAAPTALILVNSVVYVRTVLGLTDADLALALGSFGAGSMAVALAAPRALERLGDRTVMLSGAVLIPVVLAAVTALSFAGTSDWTWPVLLGLWFLIGAANSAILTPSARLLRDAADDTTAPYVFTAQFSLSHACYIVAYPLAGWLGAFAGLGPAALALTVLAILGAAGAFTSWPRSGSVPREDPASKEQILEPSAGSTAP